jgi:hypothetical protein
VIKHIVLWKLKDNALGNDKPTNIRLIKEQLEALQGKIPGLLKIEVGADFVHGPVSADVGVYCELADRAALETYRVDPQHVAVAGAFKDAFNERLVLDYET